MRALRIGAATLALAACTKVDIDVVDVARVEEYPATHVLGDGAGAWTPNDTEFVRVDFSSDSRLEALPWSNDMSFRYDLHVCDAPDTYTHSGDLFADPQHPGVYQAYVPAHFSNLHFWVTGNGSGQIGRGWPDEVRNEELCFSIYGGVNYGWTFYSDASAVQGLAREFTADVSRSRH